MVVEDGGGRKKRPRRPFSPQIEAVCLSVKATTTTTTTIEIRKRRDLYHYIKKKGGVQNPVAKHTSGTKRKSVNNDEDKRRRWRTEAKGREGRRGNVQYEFM